MKTVEFEDKLYHKCGSCGIMLEVSRCVIGTTCTECRRAIYTDEPITWKLSKNESHDSFIKVINKHLKSYFDRTLGK